MQTSTSMQFTPEVERITRPIYERIRDVIPEVEWPVHAPLIAAINDLKRERNAVILAHNYQTPEISYGVADFRGDSLGLAQQGAATDADVIVMCGVRFMAETAKIMSPDKTVLLPDMEAGCSLAASITGADVRRLKAQYPGVPVVCYVNAYADVRAEADICCTSANAVKVVESLGTDRVIFIPDGYLGRYVAGKTNVEIILWEGACEVHERFTPQEIREYRRMQPGVHVMAHPECPPEVLREADYVGSTSGMIRHIDRGAAAQGRADHRVLDERQRRRGISRRRVRPPLQSVPAHEAHHAAQDPAVPGDAEPRHRSGAGASRQAPGAPWNACWPSAAPP